jgi:hypothetical protein
MTNGYQPEWDIDRETGEVGEDTVRALLGNHNFEVKRKSRVDDTLYIELEQDPGAKDCWQPSGLNVTKAEYWAFVVNDTGVVLFFPTALLKRVVPEFACRMTRTDPTKENPNPTRGALIRAAYLIQQAGLDSDTPK